MRSFSFLFLFSLLILGLTAGSVVSASTAGQDTGGLLPSGSSVTSDNYASVAEWTNLAADLNNKGKYEEALDAVERALEIDSTTYARPWYNKGNILYNLKRYKEAVLAYDSAISIDPEDSDAGYRDRAAQKAGLNSNVESGTDASGTGSGGGDKIDTKTSGNYASVAEWTNLAADLNNKGKYEAALDAVERALEIDSTTYARPWYNKGNILYNLKRYKEAVQAYDSAISIDPEDSDAGYRDRAAQKAGLNSNVESGTDASGTGSSGGVDIIDTKSSDNYASVAEWTNLAADLNNKGKYEEALDAVERALEIDSTTYARPWYNKGNILYNLKRYKEAVQAYDSAISIDPEDSDAEYRDRVAQKAGLNSNDESGTDIRETGTSAGTKNTDAEILVNRAITLYEQDKLSEALDVCNQAIELDTNNLNAWKLKALILSREQKYQESVIAYDRVLEIDPTDENSRTIRDHALKNLN